MSTFTERLLTAIGDDNPHSFALKCGLRDSLIRKYIKDGALPRMDNLVTIARTAGVNLEWLATGEGAMRPGEPKEDESKAEDYTEKRIIQYGRRRTDQPMSNQLRRAVDGLIHLEQADLDEFTILCGKIIETEKKLRENEELKKTSNASN